jgi:hypothetical protein
VGIGSQRVLLARLAMGGSRMRAARAAPSTLVGVVLAMSIAACGSESTPPQTTDPDVRAKAESIASRLDGAGQARGGLDSAAVHALLIRNCVEEHGVAVPDSPPLPRDPGVVPDVTDLDLWLNRGQPLGRGDALSDPRALQKQRQFVHAGETFAAPPYPPEAEKYLEGDPPQHIELPLPGGHGGSVIIPVGGCHGEATEKLYGVPAEKFERTRLALPRVDIVMDETVSDERVDDRLDDYEACMKDRDLQAPTPSAINEITAPVYSGVLDGSEQPSRLVELEQRAVAADQQCKKSSGLGDAFAASFVENGSAALRDSEGVVVEYGRMMRHARAVAERLPSAR